MIYVLELDYFVELTGDKVVDIIEIIYESNSIKDCADYIEDLRVSNNVSEDIESFIRINGVYIFNNSKNCAIDMNYNHYYDVKEDDEFSRKNLGKSRTRFRLLKNSGRNLSIYKSLKVFIRNKKIEEIGI